MIEEAKFLRRLGLKLPDNALTLVQQEKRLKGYKMHLEEALDEFNNVRDEIPVTMRVMFEQHVSKTAQNFQPGLTTLAWNSMNIGMLSFPFSCIKLEWFVLYQPSMILILMWWFLEYTPSGFQLPSPILS